MPSRCGSVAEIRKVLSFVGASFTLLSRPQLLFWGFLNFPRPVLKLFANEGIYSDAIDVDDETVELLVTELQVDFLGHRSQVILLFVGVGDIHARP